MRVVVDDSGDGTTSQATTSVDMASTTSGSSTGSPPDTMPLDSTSGGDGSSTDPPQTGSESGTGPLSSTSGSSTSDGTDTGTAGERTDGESSSETGPAGLCEQWAAAFDDCYPGYGYPSEYLVQVCYSYATSDACPELALEVVECEAEFGPCGGTCNAQDQALDACEQMAEGEELGCFELPVQMSSGDLETACVTAATQALTCDAMGVYIPGWTMYVDYANALEYTTNFCTQGAYWAFLFDASDSCLGAYEDLLACISTLTCDEFADAVFPSGVDDLCPGLGTAVECKCDLEIN